MNPTRQQIITYGGELRRMMKSDAFTYAIDALRKDLSRRVFDSALHETHQREAAYRLNLTLDELLTTLNTFAVASELEALSPDDNL